MSYPMLEIYPQRLRRNAEVLRELCAAHGIEAAAVIKGFSALPAIVDALVEAGFSTVCSTRMLHLEESKRRHPLLRTVSLRISMPSEVDEVVRVADISLESERSTLELLSAAALRQGKQHGVILMRDLGDLREGVFVADEFYALAQYAEMLPGIELSGIGVNLSCYGSIVPDRHNLGLLAEDARQIERLIGRRPEIVSGGSTSSLPLLVCGEMPQGITQLRLGEALVVPCDLMDYWKCPLEGLRNDCLILRAEVIEQNVKPTMPQGQLGVDAFGCVGSYLDRGLRRRVLLALGVMDIGDPERLIPLLPGAEVVGASSDHLILDVEDCPVPPQVGDIIGFELHYKAMMFACLSPLIEKRVMHQ